MHFTKMEGLGNDYLYFYGEVSDPAEVSRKLSDRHFGIGSDGIISISPSDVADFKMRIFNADGSEAKMCGNGIRCVGKYVYDKGYTKKTRLSIETLSGIRTLDLIVENGKAVAASVNMGLVTVGESQSFDVCAQNVSAVPVSVGNPHAVIFVPDAEKAPVDSVGPALEHHEAFPDGVNVEFVAVTGPAALRMRVWERGSGITMACGTGACASAAAAVKAGYCPANTDIAVTLDGGVLHIRVLPDGTVLMTGPATKICECEVEEA